MRIRETFLYEAMIPETRAAFDQILEGAAEGDMTGLQAYVAANPPIE